MEQLPCSRVAHVFRKASPYSYPDGKKGTIQNYNKNRLAAVWLDDWIEYFDALNPGNRINYTNRCDSVVFDFLLSFFFFSI